MKKTLLLDGAMGTELISRGLELPLPIWSANANLSHPKIVTEIHQDYIDSGVDIITTNTFRSTTWTYRKSGYSKNIAKVKAKESLESGIECAQNVKGTKRIAGSITTIDDCYKPEMYPGDDIANDHYPEIINHMINNGVDLLLFETMGNINEISVILDILESYSIETWFSLILKGENLLDGNSINEVVDIMKKKNIQVLLNNCNKLNFNLTGINNLKNKWGDQWGIYPNLGISDYSNNFFKTVDSNIFSKKIKTILEMEPDVIGLCCGSNVSYVKRLKQMIEEIKYES